MSELRVNAINEQAADAGVTIEGVLFRDGAAALNAVGSDRGNAAATLAWGTDSPVQRWATTLTADRAVTLSTATAENGATFRIVRTAGGAFNLNVGTGPLKALAANTWCEVTYDGSAWVLTAYGAL